MTAAAASRSGQLRLRLPVELHTALAAEAKRQGVSLNTWIVTLLAASNKRETQNGSRG
jgi:predicted HicB family RNase H-like nuclease